MKTFSNGVLIAETRGYESLQPSTWGYAYDPDTLGITAVTGPDDRVTTMTYDASGNMLSMVDGEGRAWSWTYDGFNNVLTETGPNPSAYGPSSVTTTYSYDGSGRLLSSSAPLYDAANPSTPAAVQTTFVRGDVAHPDDVTAVTDPEGKTTTFSHDPDSGLVVSSTDPLGGESTFCYDTRGFLVESVPAKGSPHVCGTANVFKTSYTYNEYGQPLTLTPPAPAGPETYTYDADGNVVTATVHPDGNPANDQTTTYHYDPAGQLLEVDRADGSTIASEYWPDGTLKAQIDGSATTMFAYDHDPQGRLVSVTDALGLVTSYAYDPAGRVTAKTDPVDSCGTGVACVTSYTYNGAGQPTSITYSDGMTAGVAFTYRPNGQQATMVDGTGTTTFDYDSLGRLTSHTDGAATTIGYGYDLRGLPTSLTYPGSLTVTRTFDDAGRIESISDWAGRTFDYSIDPNGNITQIDFPTGSTNSDLMVYDNADRLISTVMQTGGLPVVELDYGLDQTGRLVDETRTGVPGGDQRYGYTKLDQLCFDAPAASTGGDCTSPPTGADPYSYDPADNLTQLPAAATQQFNTANQLCWTAVSPSANPCGTPPSGATTFSYDTRGNRTTTTPTSGPTIDYSYDQANRLTQVTTAGTPTATYTYNGTGLRTSKTVGMATTDYTWDHSTGLPLMLIEGDNYWVYNPDGTPLERVDSSGAGDPLYHHHDRLGSTRLITDQTGTTTATTTYDPYGTPTTTGTPTTLGYTSQQHDPETGLIYLRTRHYDPTTGNFLQTDPIATTTREPYAYVGNNPLNNTDPTGLWCITGTNKDGRCRGARAIEKYADDVANIAGGLAVACGIGAAVATVTIVGTPVGGVLATCSAAATAASVGASSLHTGLTCYGERDEYCGRAIGSWLVTTGGAAVGFWAGKATSTFFKQAGLGGLKVTEEEAKALGLLWSSAGGGFGSLFGVFALDTTERPENC